MDSNQTLHDFVLNLITNPEALSAFQLDPEASLNEAGLGDITAADVQDAIPLVVDYTSVHGTAGLNPAVLDSSMVSSDPTDVVGQLQALTQQLTVAAQPTSVDGSIAAVGTFAVNPGGIGVQTIAGGGYAGPSGAEADLSEANDLAETLDSDVVGPVTEDATGTLDGTTGGALGTADGMLGSGWTPLDELGGLGDPLGELTGEPPVSIPELGLDEGSSPLDGVTGSVGGTLDGTGAGDVLGDDTEADAATPAGAGGLDSGGLTVLDDATDILF
jgi:hypothetical protein